jgi:hypothetical protein
MAALVGGAATPLTTISRAILIIKVDTSIRSAGRRLARVAPVETAVSSRHRRSALGLSRRPTSNSSRRPAGHRLGRDQRNTPDGVASQIVAERESRRLLDDLISPRSIVKTIRVRPNERPATSDSRQWCSARSPCASLVLWRD